MQLTNEELAVKIHSGAGEYITELYNNCCRLLYKYALIYYNNSPDKCAACGVEIDDLVNEGYFALLDAVVAYAGSDREYKFTTYLRYPLLNRFNTLLGFRTRKGRSEPLNRSCSLDAPAPGTDELSLKDIIPDNGAAETFEEAENGDYYETLICELNKLPSDMLNAIKRYYFNGESLSQIAKTEKVSFQAIEQRRQKALRRLRTNGRIKRCYSSDFAYRHTSLQSFDITWTSSTEWAVLRAEPEGFKSI